MEDSFRVRVDKAFGSLSSASTVTTSSSTLSSLWSLTDENIERKQWNRDKGSPNDDDDDLQNKSYPSNLDGFFANQQTASSQAKSLSDFESDLQEFNDDVDEESINYEQQRLDSRSRLSVKPDDYNDEEWDIRSSVGLDCTLDYEEEEDAYDKVAIGRESADGCLYVKGITDYEANMNPYFEFPDRFGHVIRDPRADCIAARVRIKEDAEAARDFDTVPPAVDSQNDTLEDGGSLKSILKRRDDQMDSKSEKRVRFDPGCKDHCEQESEGTKHMAMEEAQASEAAWSQDSSGVPDYIRNPSKYTHYTFDLLSDTDEESNRKAYMDFLKLSTTMESQGEVLIDLPISVTFTPKKKPSDTSEKNVGEFNQNQGDVCKEKGLPIGIAAGDAQESEVSAMEEDEPETDEKCSSLQRSGRQYRTKAPVDLD